MDDTARTEVLLKQILETQQAYLEEYKKVTTESRELQRTQVEMFQRQVTLYRRVVAVSGVVVAALLGWWLYCTL